MTKDVDKLIEELGRETFDEIKAFAKKSKAEGKGPDAIVAALEVKFGKKIVKLITKASVVVIV